MTLGGYVLVVEVEDAGVDHPVPAGFRPAHLPYPPGPLQVEIEADAGNLEKTYGGDIKEFTNFSPFLLIFDKLFCRLVIRPAQGCQPWPIDQEAIIWNQP